MIPDSSRVAAIRLNGRRVTSTEVTPEACFAPAEVVEDQRTFPQVELDAEERALYDARQAGNTLKQAGKALRWSAQRTERVRARLLRRMKAAISVDLLPILEEEARKRQEASRAASGEKVGSKVSEKIHPPSDRNQNKAAAEAAKVTEENEPAIRGGGTSTRPFFLERLPGGRRVCSLSILTEVFQQIMAAESLQPVETKYDKNVLKNISAKRLEPAFLSTVCKEQNFMNHPFSPRPTQMPPAVEQPKAPQRKKTAESKPRHTEITSAIEQAISAADGREYFQEQQRLDALRGRRDEIQTRLGALIHAAAPEDDVNLRISDALAGQIRSEDRLGAIRTADIRLREIEVLVEHQSIVTKRAESAYHRQMAELLRPAHEAIVGRIATKLRALAIELEAEEALFNELLNERGLRQGSLRRMGAPRELLGDGLAVWLKEAAGAGYSAAVQ